jgi:hypothetical protein
MEVVSSCPMRVMGFVWQSSAGTIAQTLVVKATFALEHGQAKLAPEQEAICDQDRFVAGVLFAPSDKVPYKPRADVMLVGHAYAPNKQTVRSLVTRLCVGPVSKSIEVWCDRGFRSRDDRLLEGPRYSKMPLDWTRAAGGAGTPNPVGMSLDATPDAFGLVPVPNLQPAKTFVVKRSDMFAPIAYGPIAPTWPGRAERLGRLSGHFVQPGWEQQPLPEGLAFDYFQAAPPDQQLAIIRPDELIVLEHLHPVHAQLTTRLPGVVPKASVLRASGEREDVVLVADTLWFDSDRGICCVVWRGSIGLRHAAEAGRIVVSLDEPDVELLDDNLVVTMPHEMVGDDEFAAMTLAAPFDAKLKEPAMPFVDADTRGRSSRAAREDDDGALPFGPRGFLALPPAPIAMGQVTLPAQYPASTTIMQEMNTNEASLRNNSPPSAPSSPPISTVPQSATAKSAWDDATMRDGIGYSNPSASVVASAREWQQILWHDADRFTNASHCHDALAKAPGWDESGVEIAFDSSIGENGVFVPPIVHVIGELELPFDEFETLRAVMSTAIPVVTQADEELSAVVGVAREFVQTPGLVAAPGVSEELTRRIRVAFAKEKTELPTDYIDAHTERALLLGRHYQKREVFGGTFVRCLIWLPGESKSLVGYLPAHAPKNLPMWKRFRVHIMAEVHPAQDPFEETRRSAKVLAVVRVGAP